MLGLAAVAMGIVVGLASGGSWRALQAIRLRFEFAIVVLFVLQAIVRGRIVGASASPFAILVWEAVCTVLVFVLLPSWREPGIWVLIAGLGLNLSVVLLNTGMPVVLPSAIDAGSAYSSVLRSVGFYQLAGPGTVGAVFGDSMPLWLPNARVLLSPGDILLCIGVATFLVGAMKSCDVVATDAGC